MTRNGRVELHQLLMGRRASSSSPFAPLRRQGTVAHVRHRIIKQESQPRLHGERKISSSGWKAA